MVLVSSTAEWKALQQEAENIQTSNLHLRNLLQDTARNAAFTAEHNGIYMDYSHQKMTQNTFKLLMDLAEKQQLRQKITAMASGEKINSTENRSVLHMALRAARDDVFTSDGVNVVPAVYNVLDRIKAFVGCVRSGEWRGHTGKLLTNVVSIGIGGSYLGAEFVAEALRTDPGSAEAASGRRLSFLANVDPVAVQRAIAGLDPETTLVVVISKTFTTAETMLNARTLRQWIVDGVGAEGVSKHVVAVSANVSGAVSFGVASGNVFEFWDWVGGRFSVTSAVGLLPLSLHYGFPSVQQFLDGARDVDQHFLTADLASNLPVILGLLGVWNSSFLQYPSRALLPYSEALLRFAAHLQQVDMESNGKRVAADGSVLDFESGEVTFGEPGTNGQHSFYQLVHQGRVVPADFIGFVKSQNPIELDDEVVSNHDELMSNFFAQPDALALGKTAEQLAAEGVSDHLIPHKTFSGNRPSTSLLMPGLTPFTTGQLLALFEHRTAVQGFVWGINSFDQWGVELGKVLGKKVRLHLQAARTGSSSDAQFNSSTSALLQRYLE